MPTSVNVTNLKINELKESQYDTAVQQGVIGANELSILTDVDAGQVIQVATLPTASADELGKIYQFVGTTDANYTNGYFYKCVSDGAATPTYSWSNIQVQASASGSYLPLSGGTMTGTISSESNTPLTVKQGTYNHSISFSGSYSTPSISMFTGSVGNRPIVSLPNVIATEITSELFKKQSNDGGFSLPRGSGYIAVQVDTMPTAGSVFLGNIVQFIGTTDSTYTHGHLYECVSDGQATPTYSWTEVQLGGGGSSYTAGTGIDITGGVISVTSPTLQNTATGSNAIGIIGAAQATGSVCIGNSANAYRLNGGIGEIAIGSNSASNANGNIAIGQHCNSGNGKSAIAIGNHASVANGKNGAIQIGWGTNNNAGTMCVALSTSGETSGSYTNYELLSADGTIPTARLTKVNSTITLTVAGWSSNTQTVNVTGMTATGVVMVSPDPTDQSAYTSAGILCTAQASGTLTFTCDTVPSADIDVNVVML